MGFIQEQGNCRGMGRALVWGLLFTQMGCATNAGMGSMIGAVAGAAVGAGAAIAARGNTRPVVAATLGGAAAGGLAGGAIGQYLDERDRQLAERARSRALDAEPGATRRPVSVAWQSDHNPGVEGAATVVDAGLARDGRRCKRLREVAYVAGKELEQAVVYCQIPQGGWVREA